MADARITIATGLQGSGENLVMRYFNVPRDVADELIEQLSRDYGQAGSRSVSEDTLNDLHQQYGQH